MSTNDLNVWVRLHGARLVEQESKRARESIKKIGDETRQTGTRGAASFEGLAKAARRTWSVLKIGTGIASGLAAVWVKQGLGFNAAFQDAETGFTTLLGSQEKATQMMADLRDVSSGTALRFTQVLEGAQYLTSMGVEAKKVKPLLTGLNNALIATGKGAGEFNEAAYVLGKIQSEGKMTQETFQQLARVTPFLGKILRKELDLTPDQLKNIAREGITAEQVLDALSKAWNEGDIAKAGERSSKDFTVQLTNIRKNYEQLQRVTTKPLFVWLNEQVLPRALQASNDAIKQFEKGLASGGMMAGLSAMIASFDRSVGAGGALSAAWERLTQAAQDLGEIFTGAVIPAFQTIADVTGGLLSPLSNAGDLLGLMADHTEILEPLIVGLVAAFAAYKTAVFASNVVTAVRNNLLVISTARTAGLTAATTLQFGATAKATIAQKALNLAMRMNPLGMVITAALILGGVIWQLYKRSETFRNAVHWLWGKLQAVWGWIKSNWPLLVSILAGPIGAAVVLIAKHWDKIKAGAAAVKEWFSGVWDGVTEFLSAPFEKAWEIISGVFSKIEAAWNKVRSWLPGQHDAGESMAALQRLSAQNSPWVRQQGPPAPRRATGGVVREPWTMVGERGPEPVALPYGSRVFPTRYAAAAAGQPVVEHIHVNIDGREIARAVRKVEAERGARGRRG